MKVGDRRIELLTSSVSRKRSTSELTTLNGKTLRIIPEIAGLSNLKTKIKVSLPDTDN